MKKNTMRSSMKTFDRLPRLGRVADKYRRFALVKPTADQTTVALPKQVSYTSLFGVRPDQGGYGCCVSESGTSVVMAEMLKHAPTHPPLSVSANYAQSQRNAFPNQTPQDDGLPTGASLSTYQINGYVLNSARPFPPDNDESVMLAPVPASDWIPTFEKFKAVSVDNSVDSIRRYLFTHGPVQIGMYWAHSWWYPPASGILPSPDNLVGGHAIVIAAYDDNTELFTVANSWGTDWGIQPVGAASGGWFYLPYGFATEFPDYWPGDVYSVTAP
jgi:C1A family cysteine protease